MRFVLVSMLIAPMIIATPSLDFTVLASPCRDPV
jgi:hypothetical protein